MKTFLKIVVVMILMLHTMHARAQFGRTVAINAGGVLSQSHILFYTRDTMLRMPGVDSVFAEDARTIFALNYIMIDTKKEFYRGKITHFKMSLFSKAGEYNFESNWEMLTPEMKEQLQKIQKGDKLYFEWIKTEHPDGSKPSVEPLGFRIK
jgi:hypothetical protein